jgi:Ice-binding-like
VYWSVGTTATLGASSFFAGDILAVGDIILGSDSVLKGRGLTFESVTFLGGSFMSPTANYGASDLTLARALMDFVILAGSSISFGSSQTMISDGSIGVSPGHVISGKYLLLDGSAEPYTPYSISAAMAFSIMYNTGSTLTCQHPLDASDLSGWDLLPGVYCPMNEGFSLSDLGALTLDAHNDTNAKWIFQMPGNFTTGRGSKIILKNGAKESSISWIVGAAANLGLGSEIYGNVLAVSSIYFDRYATLHGRGMSFSEVYFAGDASLRLPDGTIRPKRHDPSPSSLKGSICVISTINARYRQGLWSGSDAARAMIEAISISMGVPVEAVSCGFASQLCLTSPTGAPSLAPSGGPSLRPTGVPTATPTSPPTIKPTRRVKVMSSGNLLERSDILPLIEAEDDSIKPLSFSIYREVPGKDCFNTISLLLEPHLSLLSRQILFKLLCIRKSYQR